MDKKVNIQALQLSPMIWREAINWGVELSHGFCELLIPNIKYKDWLKKGEIEYPDLNFSPYYTEDIFNLNSGAFQNSYYHKVGFINQFGTKQVRSSIEELERNQGDNNLEHFYIFRISDLNHFISFHFQNWHILNSDFHWSRWKMYFDFIIDQTDELLGGLFRFMWCSIFERIDLTSDSFELVSQYKQFRDELEELRKNSKFIEAKFIEIRDSKRS